MIKLLDIKALMKTERGEGEALVAEKINEITIQMNKKSKDSKDVVLIMNEDMEVGDLFMVESRKISINKNQMTINTVFKKV